MLAFQSSPIIVKLIEPPHDPTGVGAAIIAALGLTGVITAAAVLCGLAIGALMFWFRSRSE